MVRIVAVALVGIAMLVATSAALAVPTGATIDAREVDLKESGDDWTASVGLTNLTNGELSVDVPRIGRGKCDPTIDKEGKVPAAEHRAFTVTLPAACEIPAGGTKFDVNVSGVGLAPYVFHVTAAPKPSDDPEWSALNVFWIALLVLAVATGGLLAWKVKRKLTTPLEYLGATWSFKESWVSNVTIAAGLLTGVFGSTEVVKAVLGEEPDRAVALATVGAAIAASMIGSGPRILEATKVRGAKEKDYFSVGGLAAATVIGVAAAFGELWVVCRAGSALDLGGFEDRLWIFVVVGAALLLLYAATNLPRTVRAGTTPPTTEKSDAIEAAEMIVAQLRKGDRVRTRTRARAGREPERRRRAGPPLDSIELAVAGGRAYAPAGPPASPSPPTPPAPAAMP